MTYRIPNNKDSLAEYSGGKLIRVSRSVQRLSLLLAMEEQSNQLVVDAGQVKVENDVDTYSIVNVINS